MNSRVINLILFRSLAAPFYRQHAGVFLFAFFLLFGIQPSFADALRAHYYIILSLLGSHWVFAIVAAIWALYGLKTALFCRASFRKRSFGFIFLLNALAPWRRLLALARLQLCLSAPMAAYGLAIVLVAVREKDPAGSLPVIGIMTAIYSASLFATFHFLGRARALQALTTRHLIRWPGRYFIFLLRFIFTRQFPAMAVVKVLSFFAIYFFARTENAVFEDRMLWLIYLTSLAGHSFIAYGMFHFMEKELRFFRNMPVRTGEMLLSLLVVYSVLLLPEIWALRGVAVEQGRPEEFLWMVLSGPAVLLLMHSLFYTEDMKTESLLGLLFGVWVVFIFFSLSTNHWLIPLVGFVFSLIIFKMSYRQYEKEAEVENPE